MTAQNHRRVFKFPQPSIASSQIAALEKQIAVLKANVASLNNRGRETRDETRHLRELVLLLGRLVRAKSEAKER